MALIHADAIYTINPGKLDEFKALVAESMRIVREQDTRTLRYDFFFNEDETVCTAREIYDGFEGLVESMTHNAEVFPKLFAITTYRFLIYGEPTPELRAFASQYGCELHTHFMSRER
ncbi:MAG: hypothetical protein H6713_36320 [Myxococcales bacterium]|nr:hypothetical protein [Myxococcales bacterium]